MKESIAMRSMAVGVLIASLVAGCGESTTNESDDSAASDDTAQTQESTPEPKPKSSDCKKAPQAVVKGLSTGLEGGVKLSDAYLVRSDDFEHAYFVSGHLNGPGVEDEVATWVTNDAKGNAVYYAVGGMAEQFSDWGDGGSTDAGFSLSDHGAAESQQCVD